MIQIIFQKYPVLSLFNIYNYSTKNPLTCRTFISLIHFMLYGLFSLSLLLFVHDGFNPPL